jgi:hypothetical protein
LPFFFAGRVSFTEQSGQATQQHSDRRVVQKNIAECPEQTAFEKKENKHGSFQPAAPDKYRTLGSFDRRTAKK